MVGNGTLPLLVEVLELRQPSKDPQDMKLKRGRNEGMLRIATLLMRGVDTEREMAGSSYVALFTAGILVTDYKVAVFLAGNTDSCMLSNMTLQKKVHLFSTQEFRCALAWRWLARM